ncbi:hypothetical protein [Chryseobacterium sp. 5_R23647]|uniref:hypothetical protein n=1 Tax=Chryseobacterium sp. 5_R23647 TaxID=2258964 RepID=UPI000E27059D|nr:hypothetical protein [Chryseobacterium sp. 5_R23647]REC40484.1 hypothetical protein DRF69_18495 [Chryseobacterium sp. 5_R23647]
MNVKNLLEQTKIINQNSIKTELINEILKKNNVELTVNNIDDLKLNSPTNLSSIRISSAYHQRFLTIKEDLKASGISISSQEFFDFIISQFFKNT